MTSIKRPRPVSEEGEDELFRLQQEFLHKRQACSTQVIKPNNGASAGGERAVNRNQEAVKLIADNHDIPNMFGLTIVERDTSNVRRVAPPTAAKSGFPQPVRRDTNSTESTGTTSKSSIFARQFKLKVAVNETKETQSAPLGDKSAVIGEKSLILDGSGLGVDGARELRAIHDENVKRINAMSASEIAEARHQLMTQLDPKLVAFIKNKSQQQPPTRDVQMVTLDGDTTTRATSDAARHANSDEQIRSRDDNNEMDFLTLSQDEIRCKKWLNMNVIETDKLAWMRPLEPTSATSPAQEARFDFEGDLVVDGAQIDTHKGLHHHGESPEQAGYTIGELITFIESTLPSQKLVGLRTLGKLMDKAHKGSSRFANCALEFNFGR